LQLHPKTQVLLVNNQQDLTLARRHPRHPNPDIGVLSRAISGTTRHVGIIRIRMDDHADQMMGSRAKYAVVDFICFFASYLRMEPEIRCLSKKQLLRLNFSALIKLYEAILPIPVSVRHTDTLDDNWNMENTEIQKISILPSLVLCYFDDTLRVTIDTK
jgi:hypothetical protein